MALVVLPTASNASVDFLTSSGNSAISAMPPALSVTGPKASRATTIPANASIEVAAMERPYRPAVKYEIIIPAQITMTGRAVASMETAIPCIMLVAWPVSDAFATLLTGL